MARKKLELENKEFNFDEFKSQINEYIKERTDREVNSTIDKISKRIIRQKNMIIFRKNIIILVLVAIIGLLGFQLYNISDIDIDIKRTNKETKEMIVKDEKKEDLLKDKINKYGYLLDKYYISEENDVKNEFYNGDLTDSVKMYLSLNNMDENNILIEDDTTLIEEDNLKDTYNKLFSGNFNLKSFNYNNHNYLYIKSKGIFIGDTKYNKEYSNIKKEILAIDDKDDLTIDTCEGIVKDNKLYNPLTYNEIKDYDSAKNMKDYKDELVKIRYHFSKDNKLIKIEKIN